MKLEQIESSIEWAASDHTERGQDTVDISRPSGDTTEVFGSYTNLRDRHRGKRAGILGGLGKMYTKIGPKFKLLCIIPSVYSYFICPLVTSLSKVTTKLG